MKNKTLTAYKGFFKDLTCGNRMQYEVGKTFSVEPPIHKCAHGLHACTNPIDTLSYYRPKTSRYAMVSLSGDMDRETADDNFYQYTCSVDSKVAAQKLSVDRACNCSISCSNNKLYRELRK